VISDGVVRCLVCERLCVLSEGATGVCRNYKNTSGKLYHIGYGILSAVESRPIEIKPLYHYWPNSTALTFSGFGCNFYCPWCQNSLISFSQLPEDREVTPPSVLVQEALIRGDDGLCASFNEPATLLDYLLDVFELGRGVGLYSTVVTNGYLTKGALRELINSGADGFSIDIKGCPKERPKALGTVNHEVILRNAKYLIDLGAHVEMVYLVVTDFNDDDECIKWIIGKHLDILGPEVPLHVNRYYPANYWRARETPLEKLLSIRDYALREGLHYVYVGNVGSAELETTKCPNCGKTLITRSWYRVRYYGLTPDGRCQRCGFKVYLRGRYVPKKSRLFD